MIVTEFGVTINKNKSGKVTTPVIDPVNEYNAGFTANPAIAFGKLLCFNHGMPSRRR